jgi:hypothetical protein
MADNIRVQSLLSAEIGGAFLSSDVLSKTLTPGASDLDLGSGTQIIGTGSDEAIAQSPDVAGIRLIEVRNLDATNYVEISNATGGSFATGLFCRLLPSGPPLLVTIPSGSTLYAKANTANCRISWKVVEYGN